jgi:hypothetical protein
MGQNVRLDNSGSDPADDYMFFYVVDFSSFRGADCVVDCYLVVARIRERLSINEQCRI